MAGKDPWVIVPKCCGEPHLTHTVSVIGYYVPVMVVSLFIGIEAEYVSPSGSRYVLPHDERAK